MLLEMTGFASFREKTEVSFADTDYFALVGPTGAGKSTVIDALTFALYGSVARWDHEGLVAPALAPTVNRATVRLVFDAGGTRYHVVREVRRSGGKKPTVSVKNVRLERLIDPTALGGPEDDADAVAADSEVTPAVERLLGLTFKHFCTCVALPQGDFAEFLHAKAADRQKILIKLLGLEVYERIGRRAGVTAEQQKQRAAVLTEQLGSYADATEEAVAEHAARRVALVELDARVTAALPGLNDATRTHDEARQRVATLTKELSVLDAVERPDGVEDLETRRRAAADAATAARGALETAETADEAARAALAAAPARSELERIRADRTEFEETGKALPRLEEAAKTALRAKDAAAVAVTEAVAVVETARKIRDSTARAAEDAAAEAGRARQDRDRLAGLRPPADLGDLSADAARVAKRTAAAAARLSAAETADTEARAALAAQPDVAPLAAARSDARTLYALCEAQRKAAPERATRRTELEAARSTFARADAEVTAAKAAAAEAERAGQALSLRTGLAVGQPCPVCEQEVTALPDAGGHAHLAEARERLEHAERRRAAAEAAVRKLERAVDRDADSAATAAAQAEELRAVLVEGSDIRGFAAGGGLGRSGSREGGSDIGGFAAGGGLGRSGSGEGGSDIEGSASGGGPGRSGSRGAGSDIGGSASGEELGRSGSGEGGSDIEGSASGGGLGRSGSRGAGSDIGDSVPDGGLGHLDPREGGSDIRDSAPGGRLRHPGPRKAGPPESPVLLRRIEASFTEQDFADLVAAVRERGEWLSKTIEGRARVAEAANAADRELAAARAERAAAQREADGVEKSFAAAREALRAARDPLVELGAPAVDGDDVPAGWRRLTGWAATALADRRTALAALEAAAEAVGKEAVVAADDLASAERNAEERRQRAVDAGLAEQAAGTELATARRRHGELAATLAGAPTADVVTAQLAKVASLEEAAKKADADLRTARAAAKRATEAQAGIGAQVDAARQRLSRARDPLVGLGAPPIDGFSGVRVAEPPARGEAPVVTDGFSGARVAGPPARGEAPVVADGFSGARVASPPAGGEAPVVTDGESLLDAWTRLTDWAAAQAKDHRERLAVAKTAESEAAEALQAAERAVAVDVTALGIALPDGPVRDRVPVAVAAARARAEADHADLKRRVARVAGLHEDIAAAESEAQVARLLADLLRSDKFPRWLIAGALDTLVAEASASLLELSGGQFELTHDKGDFLVVDHNEADARRPVKTLSGGETFQASLALALALSSQLGAMAVDGATRLESIFLDEGFGTLDEATLDVVASTLENLAASGSRMVGVITHVPALAERVPVRFLVTRDGTGSHIAREGA
ncbi:AAA family ATPase [Amycolatopsis sp. lyj-346]|uniref:AAA family ATPase n=1 Tax=Amycolatopsis sp. lyj-346 TaxID=2789289 RepID=UPI00397D0433